MKSVLKEANEFLRRKDYERAEKLYRDFLGKHPFFIDIIKVNLDLIEKNKSKSSVEPITSSNRKRKIISATMIKNEMDILDSWINFNIKFFDHMLIIDHMSTDGTYEALLELERKNPNIKIFRYTEPAYEQDKALEILRNYSTTIDNLEWLFFLDADEFLNFESKTHLIDVLGKYDSYDILSFQWINCFPLVSINDSLKGSGVYLQSKANSKMGKIAIRENIVKDANYVIRKGMHSIDHVTYGQIHGFVMGEIMHIPLRSMLQVWSKILNGCISYLCFPDYDGRQGAHWFKLLKIITDSKYEFLQLATAVGSGYGIGNSNAVFNFKKDDYLEKEISLPASDYLYKNFFIKEDKNDYICGLIAKFSNLIGRDLIEKFDLNIDKLSDVQESLKKAVDDNNYFKDISLCIYTDAKEKEVKESTEIISSILANEMAVIRKASFGYIVMDSLALPNSLSNSHFIKEAIAEVINKDLSFNKIKNANNKFDLEILLPFSKNDIQLLLRDFFSKRVYEKSVLLILIDREIYESLDVLSWDSINKILGKGKIRKINQYVAIPFLGGKDYAF